MLFLEIVATSAKVHQCQFFCMLAVGCLLCACSSLPSVTSAITPYRMDIRQGNMVTQEMVAQLKPGMTKEQVRFALGTPLVADVFHADRWDYVYRFKPGRGETQQRRITVVFEDGKLARVSGDVVANEPGQSAAAGTEPVVAGRNRVIEIGGPAASAGAEPPVPPSTVESSAGAPEGVPEIPR
jgi:outer membrane protein assembly factor BamE